MKRIIIVLTILLSACVKSKLDIKKPPSPTVAILTAPAQNEVCTTGTILSLDQSSISFNWQPGINTDGFTLVVKNLLTSDSMLISTTQPDVALTLLRGVPYSWYVISIYKQTNITVKSSIWKFYNAGSGAISYPPYPANITSPLFGQNVNANSSTINLNWMGDIVSPSVITGYDIYFGTSNILNKIATNISDMFLNDIPVLSKTTYYWKVVSRNQNGDTSDSGIYEFTVN
jgi:hypothetical protein